MADARTNAAVVACRADAPDAAAVFAAARASVDALPAGPIKACRLFALANALRKTAESTGSAAAAAADRADAGDLLFAADALAAHEDDAALRCRIAGALSRLYRTEAAPPRRYG